MLFFPVYNGVQVSRLAGEELDIVEDSTVYDKLQISETLFQIQEGNKGTGGKLYRTCDSRVFLEWERFHVRTSSWLAGITLIASGKAILGFVKLLNSWVFLLVRERQCVGSIYGHQVFEVASTTNIRCVEYCACLLVFKLVYCDE